MNEQWVIFCRPGTTQLARAHRRLILKPALREVSSGIVELIHTNDERMSGPVGLGGWNQ
jgi:hypothetical protein